MSDKKTIVRTATELADAVSNSSIATIVVQGHIDGVPSLQLSPGQSLEGADTESTIRFALHQDGLQLTTSNSITGLRLETSITHRAIYNSTEVESLGTLHLHDVTTTGQVQILVRDKVRSGHLEVMGLDVISADTRGQTDRPQGFGVHVIQGAFTLWNMQADASVVVTAELSGLSAGRPAKPVIGSGIFVSGPGFGEGALSVSRLETDAVYSDGKIDAGTADVITGGVFTVYGAYVDLVHNYGPVVTYGVNDMALDNWGKVDRWVAEDKVTTYGASGIGFVNFGSLGWLHVKAPIETFGQGSRGFNLYAGSVNEAVFDRISTHADGAVGVQISQPMGTLKVLRGIETFGGTGDSLVKGKVMRLSAIGLSIKPGAALDEVCIEGGLTTHGSNVVPLEVHDQIGVLHIEGGIRCQNSPEEKKD